MDNYYSPSKPFHIGKLRSSKRELIDISKAWISISFAFALIFSGISLLGAGPLSFSGIFSLSFVLTFMISLLTAGLGFLLHELGHKFVAQYYGCEAEFRASDQMLYIAVGLAAVVGFLFAAPGAVMIVGNVTRKENGIISIAGPLTNYILAILFFVPLQLLNPQNALIALPLALGFQINMWLGLFNLLPFGMFDGKKIVYWSAPAWTAMVAFGVLFLFVL